MLSRDSRITPLMDPRGGPGALCQAAAFVGANCCFSALQFDIIWVSGFTAIPLALLYAFQLFLTAAALGRVGANRRHGRTAMALRIGFCVASMVASYGYVAVFWPLLRGAATHGLPS